MKLFLSLLAILAFVFWVFMLVHAAGNRGLRDGEKIAWVLIILFLNLLGAVLYFAVVKARTGRGLIT